MKGYFFITLIFVAFLTLTSLSAADLNNKSSEITKEIIVDNLIVGVNSQNSGLKLSAAFYLGELKASKAVIPLMRILHDDKEESARISAALALTKIKDARGVYAVKRASIFDDSKRVRNICEKFYLQHLKNRANS